MLVAFGGIPRSGELSQGLPSGANLRIHHARQLAEFLPVPALPAISGYPRFALTALRTG